MNASSGRDAISGMANSDKGQSMGITANFENVYETKSTLHTFIAVDETRNKFPVQGR